MPVRRLGLVLLLACDPASPVSWRVDEGKLHVTVEGYTKVCEDPILSTEQPDGQWEPVNPRDPACTYEDCSGPITRYEIELPEGNARRVLDVTYYTDLTCQKKQRLNVQLD